MSSNLKLDLAFSVPFGEVYFEDCGELNRELEALFLSRETPEERNPTPTHWAQEELFESRFNLFRWPEPCVQALRRMMLDSVVAMVRDTTALLPADLLRLQIENHTWFHITRYGGSFVAHNHPLATWSAVYCVRPGNKPVNFPGSGALRFFDTRSGANLFLDPASRAQKAPYAAGIREYQLRAGQLVIFPSYVLHEVAPFYGDDTRITVATNCWFRFG